MRGTHNNILKKIQGNQNVIEIGKLVVIGLLSLISLSISIFFLFFSPYTSFQFVYVFIPHLYLIPIILLALWYPKSGLRLVFVIILSLFLFWIFAGIFGYSFPPLFVLIYTGVDLAAFVVFLLYVKDRRLVEAVIIDIIERGTTKKKIELDGYNTIEGDFDSIINSLRSLDEGTREEAVLALSDLNDERSIFPLVMALRDDSPYVRRRAAEALGNTHSHKAVKPLIESLTDDDRDVREISAEALGHLGKIAYSELINGLSNPDWRIRIGGVIALRVSYDIPNLDGIIRLLNDDSPYVRREAVKTLGRVGDKRILPFLIEATNDPDPGVRVRAVRAIAKIGTQKEVLKVLTRCLQDPDGTVRVSVGEEIQKIEQQLSLK